MPLPPAAPPLPLTATFTVPLTGPLAGSPAGTAGPLYPRESTTWGADGGWVPTTSGYETRVYEPPKLAPSCRRSSSPSRSSTAFSTTSPLRGPKVGGKAAVQGSISRANPRSPCFFRRPQKADPKFQKGQP